MEFFPDFPSSLVVEAYLSPTVDDSCEKCSWSLPNLDLLREYPFELVKLFTCLCYVMYDHSYADLLNLYCKTFPE